MQIFNSLKIYKIILISLVFLPFKIFASEKDIVVIESYTKEYKWDLDYINELKEKLGNKYHLEFFEMNTKKLPKSEHEKMGIKAFNFIKKINPIMVILGDDAALKFVGPKLEENKIKTVYLGINNNPRLYFSEKPIYVTGILERPIIKQFPEFLLKLNPNIKKVLILFDDDITSQVVYKDFFSENPKINFPKINYDIFLISKFSEWKNKIINAKQQYDAIIIGPSSTLVDENKNNVDTNKVVSWSSSNSKIPIFAFWDFSVGKNKALGGLVLTGGGQGKAAGELAEKLLNNPNILPGTMIPIFLQEGKYIFSKHELKKYKITLPKSIENASSFIE